MAWAGSPAVRALVGLAVLAVLVWRLGSEAFVEGLRVVDARSVLPALGIGLVSTLCSAARWRLVARRLGLPLPYATAVADSYRAQFLNTVLPTGVLGDVHRGVSHGRDAGDLGRGVRAVVLERTAGQVVLVVTGVLVLLVAPRASGVTGLLPVGEITLAVVVVAVAGLAAWARVGRRAARLRAAVGTGLTDARAGLLARDAWPGVVALSVAALAGYLALFLVAARAAGVAAPVAQLLPLLVLALFAMGLPLNVAGWGPREAVAAVAFGAAGLGAAQGLATSVAYGVLTLVAALPGGVVLLVRWLSRRSVTHAEGPGVTPQPATHGSLGA